MKLVVMQRHEGEGVFPLFRKGTAVRLLDTEEAVEGNWFPCDIQGHLTYIPPMFLTDGVLNRNYNPTEMVAEEGKTVDLMEVVFEWLCVRDRAGNQGWIPSGKVVSLSWSNR